MRKILFILLLFPVFVYGQISVIGRYPFSNSSYLTESPYTILYQWDFNDYSLGDFSADSISKYFNVADPSGPDWARTNIVMDTIDGTPTQVLDITMDDGVEMLQRGLQAVFWFDNAQTQFDSVCFSYKVKFDKDFEAIAGNGKILGLRSVGQERDVLCLIEDGVSYSTIWKTGFRISDYNYDWIAKNGSCPWTTDQDPLWDYWAYDSAWAIPGVWNEHTVCVRTNTISGGTAQEDGKGEQWWNGGMIYQSGDIGYFERPDTAVWDAVKFAAFSSAGEDAEPWDNEWNKHNIESHLRIGQMYVWMPVGDTAWDGEGLHAPSYQMISPAVINDKTVYYDTLVNLASQSPDTIWTTNYPSAVGYGYTGAWLIDAGAGNTVTATILNGMLGTNDHLFAIDGNQSTDPILYREQGYDSNITNNFNGSGIAVSSGRYLYIYTVNSEKWDFTYFRIKVQITP